MSEAPVALINYYIRNGYCRHAQTVCNEVLKKRQNDPTMVFWRAVAMLKEGQASEAVRELEGLARRADAQMKLPVNIALLHSHRACKIADNEAIAQLEDQLMSGDEDSAPDRARLTAAQLFWHLGEIYDAKKHKALVFFFLCVQAAFLAGHSAVRGFVARKLCCCLCGGKKEEKRTPATLTAGANGDVTVHQHGNIQMVM